MDRPTAFSIWAPPSGTWSPWVKPILFADPTIEITWEDIPIPKDPTFDWTPEHANSTTAVVVELPGAEAVRAGIVLAGCGFTPVPLFNGAPGADPIVPWAATVRALMEGASELLAIRSALADYRGEERDRRTDGPPAFLLDSNRMTENRSSLASSFDNRWVAFPEDFPSGTLLRERGIQTVLLSTPDGECARDMMAVARRWRASAIEISIAKHLGDVPHPLHVGPPSRFAELWFRLQVFLRLRRSGAGAFGRAIPNAFPGAVG